MITRETLRLLHPPRFRAMSVLAHDPGDIAGGLAAVDVEAVWCDDEAPTQSAPAVTDRGATDPPTP